MLVIGRRVALLAHLLCGSLILADEPPPRILPLGDLKLSYTRDGTIAAASAPPSPAVESGTVPPRAGVVPGWLVAGPIDLPEHLRVGVNRIPRADVFDPNFLAPPTTIPNVGNPGIGGTSWKALSPGASGACDLRATIPEPGRDRLALAHAYVRCPQRLQCRLWLTSATPAAVFINAHQVLLTGSPVETDGASRTVVLMAGWNRILVALHEQENPAWPLAVRFTDVQNRPLENLTFSAARPNESVVGASVAVIPQREDVPYFRWDDVSADWATKLPDVGEAQLEALLSQRGLRVVTPPENFDGRAVAPEARRWLMLDTTSVKFVQSRTLGLDASDEALRSDRWLNNVYCAAGRSDGGTDEGLALLHYTRSTGVIGDLVFVRPDLAPLFARYGRYPSGWSGPAHAERVVGVLRRGGMSLIVFDTNVGPLPANELEMFCAANDDLRVAAICDPPRVRRGQPYKLTLRVESRGAAIRGRLVVRPGPDDTCVDPEKLPALAEQPFDVAAGGAADVAFSLDGGQAWPGPVSLAADALYEIDGNARKLTKPIVVRLCDLAELAIRFEPGESKVARTAIVTVTNRLGLTAAGTLRLAAPKGWRLEPESAKFHVGNYDQAQALRFRLLSDGEAQAGELSATAEFLDATAPQATARAELRPGS